ncbi:DUF1657 domain-containing protein [Caloranaerobacter sp. DY30410]|uniref:DUF1657 domain-containing protein n=1 Tax=Caloranaerobacter sp. DY30410 TaxID=3238305 RepID=UPI003D02F6A7
MTTINKLEKVLSSAKSLAADLKTFSLDTQDQQAKQMFNQLSSQIENISQMLQSRVDFVKNEEPQYMQESQGTPTSNQQNNTTQNTQKK